MADEIVEFIFRETEHGDVYVTTPDGEVFMMLPDGADAYQRESILSQKLSLAVAGEVVAQLKQVQMVPIPVGPSEPDQALEDSPTGGVDSRPQRKRGRPTEIPVERKRRALAVQGARARAEILYATKCPTPQQKKNVSAIMRHFNKKGI